LSGTDLYLSALGPALGEVARNWPVTDLAGRAIDLAEALDEAYKAVARWRLEQIFADLTLAADLQDVAEGFSVDAVDRDTQTLWLWLDTFQGDIAHSDDVRKLAKSLNVDPDNFKRLGLLKTDKETSCCTIPWPWICGSCRAACTGKRGCVGLPHARRTPGRSASSHALWGRPCGMRWH
jgi:hypothetical protein